MNQRSGIKSIIISSLIWHGLIGLTLWLITYNFEKPEVIEPLWVESIESVDFTPSEIETPQVETTTKKPEAPILPDEPEIPEEPEIEPDDFGISSTPMSSSKAKSSSSKKQEEKQPQTEPQKKSNTPKSSKQKASSSSLSPSDLGLDLPDEMGLPDLLTEPAVNNSPKLPNTPKVGNQGIQGSSDPRLMNYNSRLVAIMNRLWAVPKGMFDRDYNTSVSFIIAKDGSVSDIKIHKSSGVSFLDERAIKTVKRANLDPLPPRIGDTYDIVFRFKYENK
ncbi:TonB C-terminal domain-containing protein [Fibrobacterales bacterium]|nr:TonB C-terminal domain-containing protein [Fibrobacterales bacterium]